MSRGRTLTLYRDDSTSQVRYDRVKSYFFTAGNSVLTISRYDGDEGDGHHYIHWPRERFCWFRDEPAQAIEARRAETTGSVHESAVGETDASDAALLADICANMAEVLKPLPGIPDAPGQHAGTRATESGDGDEA